MNTLNIYGDIPDESDVIIGIGNRNSVHSLLTYFAKHDNLQIRPIGDIATPSILIATLLYHKDGFYLKVKGTSQYINFKIESGKAVASLSNNKCLLHCDYSIIDKNPHSRILAGSLMSLCNSQEDIYWKVQGFTPNRMIMFLPLNWYEVTDGICTQYTGLPALMDNLRNKNFTGFTDSKWCQNFPHVNNCQEGELCGNCLGPCRDSSQVCVPSGIHFVCTNPNNLPITFPAPPPTTGTSATWIAIISIFLLSVILYFGLMFYFK